MRTYYSNEKKDIGQELKAGLEQKKTIETVTQTEINNREKIDVKKAWESMGIGRYIDYIA